MMHCGHMRCLNDRETRAEDHIVQRSYVIATWSNMGAPDWMLDSVRAK